MKKKKKKIGTNKENLRRKEVEEKELEEKNLKWKSKVLGLGLGKEDEE